MYTVERIEELDFGCEGRPEGMKDMVRSHPNQRPLILLFLR